jgi:hypothetical protein
MIASFDVALFRTVPGHRVSNHQGTYSSEDLPVLKISTGSYPGRPYHSKGVRPRFIEAKLALRELPREKSQVARHSTYGFFFASPVGQSINYPRRGNRCKPIDSIGG